MAKDEYLDEIFGIEADAEKEPVIDMNDKFKLVENYWDNTDSHIFLTGDAGTGKSTLLKYLRDKGTKNCIILAPTGIAAVNIGGQTIHSFFKLKPGPITSKQKRFNYEIANVLRKADTMVIDEISMVRSDFLDDIETIMRINGPDQSRPFGGIQMVFIGDLCQLPPVVASAAEREYLRNNYKSRYFFDAKCMQYIDLVKIRLTTYYRQTDGEFIKFLKYMRSNRFNHKMVGWFNHHCPATSPFEDAINLCTTNQMADMMNQRGLDLIDSKAHIYEATTTGHINLQTTRFREPLVLKTGARIMMINNDKYGRWNNGTMGTVVLCGKYSIKVDIGGNEYEVRQETWDKKKFKADSKTGEITGELVGSITAFPIKLAWGITVHKCIEANEPVMTNRGHIPIKDINIGDLVLTHMGEYKTVIDKIRSGEQECWKITMGDGRHITCSSRHPLYNGMGWIKAGDLEIGDYLSYITHDGRRSGMKVKNIESVGIKETWDIEVDDHHSFVVRGFGCHNSQGCTFEKVNIDLGRGAFEHGQTYVALSRATSLAGIRMMRPLDMDDIIFDRAVLDFMSDF